MDPDSQVYSFETKYVRYDIPYVITNGFLDNIAIDCNRISATIGITPTGEDNGEITLTLQRDLFDIRINGTQDDFFVLLDGEEIEYQEKRFTHNRILTIPFLSDSEKIRILGSWVPEGPGPDRICKTIHDPPFSYVLPPLKQVKNDSLLPDIICKNDLELIFKTSDVPACVKQESIEKLVDRNWAKYDSIIKQNPELQIIKYSPVLFKGTGVSLTDEEFTIEDLQKTKQREKEIGKLLENSEISREQRDKLYNERKAIQLYAQNAFDAGVPFELVAILWEKQVRLIDMMVMHGKENVFPITGSSGISLDNNAYSLDEEYVGKPVALRIQILEDYFTRTNLEKTDQTMREQIGNEIDIVYEKSEGYITFESSSNSRPTNLNVITSVV